MINIYESEEFNDVVVSLDIESKKLRDSCDFTWILLLVHFTWETHEKIERGKNVKVKSIGIREMRLAHFFHCLIGSNKLLSDSLSAFVVYRAFKLGLYYIFIDQWCTHFASFFQWNWLFISLSLFNSNSNKSNNFLQSNFKFA